MIYQIESIKTKRRKKLVIVYFIILLLTLILSIYLGIVAAKKKNSTKTSDTNVKQMDIQQEEINQPIENEKDYKKFVKNVENIYNGTEEKRVFLTFDDGPSKSVTPHILDVLKENNIKATFFVLGNRVKLNPDLVKREYNEGHYIANHGYSHKYSKIYVNTKTVLDEYYKTEKQIQNAIGDSNYTSCLFRFPGGSVGGAYYKIKKQAKTELKKKNIAYLDWNALTNDAAGANTKEKLIKNLKKTVGNHTNVVLLMHDASDKILTYETLNQVITYLKQKGYSFKNMYDLL